MREKPQRKRPNKKTAGRSEARQENRPDRRKEAAGEAIEDNFVFGYHAVAEALKEGRGNKLFLSEEARGEKIDRLKEMAREQAVPVKWVPKQKLDTMSDQGVHQGMILAITPYQYLTLDELLAQTKEQSLYLILDNLEDPHNFGSIMRTADASGVDGIIIPKHRAVGITPIVVKTSTGAVEHIPVARVTNLTQAVQQLKKAGFWIFGTDMSGSDYRTWNAQGAVGLIIGNEGRGMGEGLKKEVDQMLTIPMTGHVQSLNASVAAGLLMYQAFTSRNGASQ
ncbi:23S rRNA (guanosine(2251)-2'-O)-methyltransferase RlmB [Enterococcus casseliflavus]|uniref:23S rRNA (guanosine(2251)-2'-O)-methyltransferase RlmB n=1 Tax=Enterococcus casseliflavus TaxID=37734 RepID=UPI00233128FA|nr:23S rRNA (guanosine(2251)-2'-O)-methyltransferase RlmB [Enterococcus casseliflavus]MDB1694177.1 23S rRNA (guanosine(2251)-2'-O)-methyltransferase RlmB [Enterococcus casseliflavus]MDB1697054.1 23S rRNA (guanosine(2251)-2'-O)-methyltransferase RlmB [Enterococcus casseliflavus]MDB1701549.1 23S rRNA (guanosine(2251)-2'-O)-methyltransferase RlmB [Enterococcus casseliflavus]MDB1704728.1 23S rRNA (guanosine(2251)-2'-O)-methyltransferase RlmB [Enterococcus casseliflavus]